MLAAMLNSGGNRDIVERLLDNPEGYNALINGLMQCAANLAELANKPEYDLSGELSQAVELFVETRDKGQTVDEFAAQTDMFREAPSAETMFLMRLFEENAKSSGGISGVLRQYAAECKKIDTTTQSLFGDENPTKLEKLEEAYRHYAADLSNEAGNGNLRWRDTGEPAAEEISEAQKQYEEVKSKYVGTPLWMKAPNGKRTNLTEEQWVRVRTPNFKRWFGDWEKEAWAKAAMDFLEKTAPVRELSGGEFQKDGVKLTEKVPAYFKSIGNVAHNDELGDVVLDLKGVEDSIAHGIGRLKSAAFMAVPDVIEKGFIFNREENWKERGWNTAVIVAPIKLGEDDYVCEVVVKKVRGQQRFYLHEVEIKKTLDGVFKSVANNGNASQASKLIIGKHIAEVKGNVSKVVDENGEPLAVYHGTDNTNPDYTKFTVFKHSDLRVKKYIHFFSSSRDVAGSMGSYVYDVFLNIKKPLIIDSGGNSWGAIKDHTDGKVKFFDLTDAQKKKLCKAFECTMKELESSYRADSEIDLVQAGVIKREERSTNEWAEYARVNGYDGVIFKNVRDGAGYEAMSTRADVFASFNSNQIKSATDNIGTFNTNNSDIRYSISEDDAARFKNELQDYIDGKLDNRHVFKLGTTPEVMRLVGAKNLPLELSASVLATKEAKHNLNIESLKKLPAELADPIAIFQSAQIPNGLLVITEIPDIDGKKIAVAVHLDKTRNRNLINDIRSIHGRSDFNMQTQVDMGLLRYINTKRRPHSLRLNRVAPVSGSANKTFNAGNIFTESDLSQAEKDNIFNLRAENKNFRYSIKEEKPNIYDGRFGNANRKYTRLLAQKNASWDAIYLTTICLI